MANPLDAMKQAVTHLRSGNVQAADDLLTKTIAATPPPAGTASAAAAPPAPPRAQPDVIVDLLTGIVNHLGAPPALQAFLNELLAASGL